MAFIKLTLDNPLRNCVISGDPESDETPLFDFTEDSVVFEDLKEHGLFTYPEHMITSINRILIQAALLVYSRRFDLIRVQPPVPVIHAVLLLELGRDPEFSCSSEILSMLKQDRVLSRPIRPLFCPKDTELFPTMTTTQKLFINLCTGLVSSAFDGWVRCIMRVALCIRLLQLGQAWGIYCLKDMSDFLYARRVALLKAPLSVVQTLDAALLEQGGAVIPALHTLSMPAAGVAVCASQAAELLARAGMIPTDRLLMWIMLPSMTMEVEPALRLRVGVESVVGQWYAVAYPHLVDTESSIHGETALMVACSVAPEHVFSRLKEHDKLTDKLLTVAAINGCEQAKVMLAPKIDLDALRDALLGSDNLQQFNTTYGTNHFANIFSCLSLDDWIEVLDHFCSKGMSGNIFCILQTLPLNATVSEVVDRIKPEMVLKRYATAWVTFLETCIPVLTGQTLAKAIRLLTPLKDPSYRATTTGAVDTIMLAGITP